MDKDILKLIEKGRENYENRDYKKAEAYLLKVIEEQDGFADVMNMLGIICHDKGHVAMAQEYFEKALRINPNYTEAALNLAVAFNEQGRYEQAKQIYAHVTTGPIGHKSEIEPFARGKLANMHADLGQAYSELLLFDKSIEQYHQALELSPDFVDIRTRMGQVMRDAGNVDDAIAEFEAAVKSNTNYVPARISLGVALFAKGDKTAARDTWKKVVEVDPDNKTAQMYIRMMDQLIAQDEAKDAGMDLEVDSSLPAPVASEELSFSIDGEKASVMPADGGDKSQK